MKKQTRREFLIAGAAGVAALGLTRFSVDGAVDIEEATIADLQSKMRSGELTARKLVEMYTARISEIDLKLRSVVEINPDALAIADILDNERKRGKFRGPMHGIPVLIKDNIDTADKMKTTAGSLALLDAPAPKRDAFVAKKLRAAGAVILGKTNLSEWANFRSTKSVSGWSGRGGQTNNPYILDKNPCGSSAGSGVAVSANLCAAAIGTETNGSIICPSTRNGVVGIKPTLGLVSRSGIIPIAHTQDTAGPMCRTVADAAAVLSAIVGTDKSDAITADASKGAKDYTKFLEADGLKGARLGVVRQYLGNNADTKRIFEAQLEVLKIAGATLIDVTFPEELSKLGDDRLSVLLYEFKTDLNKYLAARGSQYKTLGDLIKYNNDNKEKEMPIFAQELFEQSEAKGGLADKAYLDSLAKIKSATRENGIDALIARHDIDALVAPSTGAAWSIAAVAGYPFITVPAGFINGLPVGIGFFGKAFTEPALIKFAYAFEQKTKARRKPEYIPASQ
ncbi:MAG TPA: amidase [Pyrinomonadaceae bacterium]|nr:amidase [Pyrinomonadaceae bacterium]